VPAGKSRIKTHERMPPSDVVVTRIPVFITLLAA
jgi:hypothetical protein